MHTKCSSNAHNVWAATNWHLLSFTAKPNKTNNIFCPIVLDYHLHCSTLSSHFLSVSPVFNCMVSSMMVPQNAIVSTSLLITHLYPLTMLPCVSYIVYTGQQMWLMIAIIIPHNQCMSIPDGSVTATSPMLSPASLQLVDTLRCEAKFDAVPNVCKTLVTFKWKSQQPKAVWTIHKIMLGDSHFMDHGNPQYKKGSMIPQTSHQSNIIYQL